MKLPPIEKIPEAYSAIIDGRVKMAETSATVTSSDGEKEYLIKWNGDTYYSNDNATYWQGYPGYPVLAVLMLQGRLPYDESAATYFRGVDWHDLNNQTKRDYAASVERVIGNLPEETQASIHQAIEAVYEKLETLSLMLTRKKSLMG